MSALAQKENLVLSRIEPQTWHQLAHKGIEEAFWIPQSLQAEPIRVASASPKPKSHKGKSGAIAEPLFSLDRTSAEKKERARNELLGRAVAWISAAAIVLFALTVKYIREGHF